MSDCLALPVCRCVGVWREGEVVLNDCQQTVCDVSELLLNKVNV